jgi:hypothetical protein
MKTKYIIPAVSVMSMAVERIMLDLSYDNQEGDGPQLSKMTPFMEPEERGDIADEYFERSTKLHVEFKDIWADE